MSHKACLAILVALAFCLLSSCASGRGERLAASEQVQDEYAEQVAIARAKLAENEIRLEGCSLHVYEAQGFLVVDFQPTSFWKKSGGGKVLFRQEGGKYLFSYLVRYE